VAQGVDARGLALLTRKLPVGKSGPDGAVIQTVMLVDAKGVPIDFSNIGGGGGGTGGGTQTYSYPFVTPEAVWTINHNLNRYPTVTTVDELGAQIHGDVVYVDSNTITITFADVFAGTAYLEATSSASGTGGHTYSYPFVSPETVWLVNHGLNRYPAVSCVDDLGNEVFGDVTYMDANTLSISFVDALTGVAYLN
jgi:hypothetical protein